VNSHQRRVARRRDRRALIGNLDSFGRFQQCLDVVQGAPSNTWLRHVRDGFYAATHEQLSAQLLRPLPALITTRSTLGVTPKDAKRHTTTIIIESPETP